MSSEFVISPAGGDSEQVCIHVDEHGLIITANT